MSCCSIFDKSLLLDADINSATIDIIKIKNLIPSNTSDTSGLWQPIVIKQTDSTAQYCDPLIFTNTNIVSAFNPCNCSDSNIITMFNGADTYIGPDNLSFLQDSNLSCSYCGAPNQTEWNLKDSAGNESASFSISDCCGGACDTRMKKDDYLPKIPVLNQTYLSGFLDFKYLKQFPACTNAGLGFDRLVTIPTMSSISGADLCVDWKLKETISEIPYDKINSQHLSEYIHNKSYTKSKLVSQTCGNFIMTRVNPAFEASYSAMYSRLSGLIGSSDLSKNIGLPSIENFENMPYGFDQQTYNNIFIHNNKIASYWKWNYTSGILGWYRYYETDRQQDSRPIKGVDLYISPGDIFFATNNGPETDPAPEPDPAADPSFIKTCPSGLKVIVGNNIDCIIPNGSEFLYVSANIYAKFYQSYSKLLPLNNNDSTITLSQAALLATSPWYDQVTVDLLNSDNDEYIHNAWGQISGLNRDMSVSTNYDSVSNLNYISNTKELINTLANKYGCYLWIPPNSSKDITFSIPSQSDSFYIDLDFDMVFKASDTSFQRSNCTELSNCGSKNYVKSFYYDQKLALSANTSDTISLSTSCFEDLRYKQRCGVNNGLFALTKYDFANYSTIYLNNSRIKSVKSNNTCMVFEDIYPRIVDPGHIASYCTNCDSYSSFYLAPNAELGVCKESDFCYKSLAKKFNNLTNPPGLLQERAVSDNTLRMKRKYNALAFNPHIDMIAFHKDNGVFFNSKSFQAENLTVFDRSNSNSLNGTPKITFTTKDVGIKIYALYAEKLQSSSNNTRECKRFPVESQPCKCYGLSISDFSEHPYSCSGNNYAYANVFLPGLSTKNSPRLSKYGGYSQEELDLFFGTNVLTAGGSLAIVDNKIMPEEPYGCERSASISLQNYINTSWKITLNNFTTEHSDVFMKVTEYGDPTVNFARYVYNDVYFKARNNEEWKRFFTKVSFGGITLWKDQIKTLYAKGASVPSTTGVISLQNPYLETLTKNQNIILAPPSGDLLSGTDFIFGQPVTYGDPGVTSRGDETSTVNIALINKPRKQKLLFAIEPPVSSQSLQRGFFHPNSGLTTDNQFLNKSPFKDHRIYYDEPLYGDGYSGGLVLIGDLTPAVKSLFNSISQLDIHRKPRLYLNINNGWYEAQITNRGGFKHQQKTYIGAPAYFEYVHHNKDSKHIPGLFATSPKEHMNFSFMANHPSFFNSRTSPQTPILFNRFTTSSNRTILLSGSRYYFMIPESDPSIYIDLANINDVSSMSDSDAGQISYGTIVRFQDNQYWVFIGIDPRSSSDYTITEYNYLYHNFSDLHIDYRSTNKRGYVYNSKKQTNQTVLIYNDRGESESNIIVQKELIIKFYDEGSGKSTSLDFNSTKNFKVFTRFTLQNKPRKGYNIIDPLILFNDSSEDIKQYSLTMYAPTLWLRNEDDTYLNGVIKTKWGDVLYYDDEILDSLSSSFVDETYWYPTPTYKNSFYKLIVNNHLKNKHRYQLFIANNNKEYTVDHNDLVYYNIHQKYNTNYSDDAYSTLINQYHNYLPFIDINLLSKETSAPIRDSLSDLIKKNKPTISGTLKTTSLYNELSNNHDWGGFINPKTSDKFWIHLAEDTVLKAALVPSTTIYSPTLRIDDPPYWLYKTTKTTYTDTTLSTDCTKTFIANNINELSISENSIIPSTYTKVAEQRNREFYRYPIYCDTDNALPACGYQQCNIKKIGSISLKSQFRTARPSTLGLQSANQDSIPYILSYEGGNYNVLGIQSLSTIKRFEIEPDSWLDTNNSCSSSILKPLNLKNSILDKRYQDGLTVANDHALLVKQTDDMANEILFRMLYGEKYPINKQMLFKKTKPLTAQDLVSYSDPKITAADIYEEILYNYDRNVVPTGLVFNGTLTINGVPNIGDRFGITIGSMSINFSIKRKNGSNKETAIVLDGTIGGTVIDGKIYIEQYEENSLIVTDGSAGDPLPAGDNDNIVLVGTRTVNEKYTYFARSYPNTYAAGYSGPLAPTREPTPSGPSCEIIEQTEGKTWTPNYDSPPGYAPDTVKRTPGTYSGCVLFQPNVSVAPRPSPPSRCSSPFDQCNDFQYGYCRRNKNSGCSSCPSTFENNDGIDFQYSFDMCRNTMSVYGHTYREQHIPYDTVDTALSTVGTTEKRPCSKSTMAPGLAGQFSCYIGSFDEYVILDPFAYCNGCGSWCKDYRPGGDWTEYCVIEKCKISNKETKKVYHRTTLKILDAYNPFCPSDFFTINYTNYAITITFPKVFIDTDGAQISQYGTKSICIPVDFRGQCPYINVTSIPDGWVLKENISSECSPCNQLPLKINIPFQKQEYLTIKEKRKCIIGTFIYGTINNSPLINIGNDAIWRNQCYFVYEFPCRAGGSLIAQCGGGYPWYGCLGSLQYNITSNINSGSTESIVCEFAVPAMAEGPAAQYEYEQWKATITESYTNGTTGQENLHIPEADIVEGVVPGSVSAVPKFKTYTFPSSKARPSQNSIDDPPEIETWNVNVVVAYYDYQYIRPKTIQDILKPDNLVCNGNTTIQPDQDIPTTVTPETDNLIGQINKFGQYQCKSLAFPDNWWGWGDQGMWVGIGIGGIWGTTWLTRKPNLPQTFISTERYFKNDSCTNELSRYYKYNLEPNDPVFTSTSAWYAPPMPCASTDWYCWATAEMASKFLTAKTGQTWV